MPGLETSPSRSRPGQRRYGAALALLAATCLAQEAAAADAGTIIVRPAIDDALLLNPGKGYAQYYGSDRTSTPAYIGIGYNRWSWSQIEPRPGRFDWRCIDDFIKEFKGYGKKIAFGIMSISTGIGHEHVTPQWVFDAGAHPLAIPDSSSPTGKQVIALSFDDPVFVAKLEDFVQALGRRYDGHPDIAFLDIRSYGNWGEGHVGHLGLDLAAPEVVKTCYLQPYVNAFKKTRLIMTWGSDRYNAVYDWGITQGLGIRRDGILSKWSKDGSECLRAFGHAPAVFEYCDGYEETKKNGFWNTELLMKYVQAGKPSYMHWDEKIFKENREFCLRLGNRVGYHFILQQATLPARIAAGATLPLTWEWKNAGVAPLYEPCHVALALLDEKDQVVQDQWVADSAPGRWLPDTVTREACRVTFPHLPAGTYKLAVGLFLDRQDLHPAYRLGIQGRTRDGWYVLCDKLACDG